MPAQPVGRTFTTYGDGALRELRNQAHVSPAIGSIDDGEVLNAIWDTGATMTSISQRAADLLGLKPTGRVTMCGVNDTKEVDTYKVNLILRNEVLIQDLTVSEVEGLGGDADLLIGMDVISLGNFVVSTWRGKTSFSFECPSSQRIDLLPDNSRRNIDGPHINTMNIGRNDPCPCGSGKKYKRCCGKS